MAGLETIATQAQGWLAEPLTEIGNTQSVWQSISQPWTNAAQGLWGSATSVIQQVNQKLPDVLFGWLGQKIGLVQKPQQQGAGSTVINYQPPVAGGLPAQPVVLPGQATTIPVSTPQQAGISSSVILIAALIVVAVILLRK
jgi:hypothetical protein